MIGKLLVELECLRPRDRDRSHRPIDEQALFFGAIVSSRDMVKQESPAVSGISPKSDNLGLVLFPWKRRFLGTVQILQSWHYSWELFPFIADFNLSGLLNSLRMVIFRGCNPLDDSAREFFPQRKSEQVSGSASRVDWFRPAYASDFSP